MPENKFKTLKIIFQLAILNFLQFSSPKYDISYLKHLKHDIKLLKLEFFKNRTAFTFISFTVT